MQEIRNNDDEEEESDCEEHFEADEENESYSSSDISINSVTFEDRVIESNCSSNCLSKGKSALRQGQPPHQTGRTSEYQIKKIKPGPTTSSTSKVIDIKSSNEKY